MELRESAIGRILVHLLTSFDIFLAGLSDLRIIHKLMDALFVVFASHEVLPQCALRNTSDINLDWHAPKFTAINDLNTVINGTGIYGFIYNSSVTPSKLPYSTYNWCNMPHVRPQEYVMPPDEYKLEYVEVIHRHHKRTPYASNTFPHETYTWSCDDEGLFHYATPLPGGTSAYVAWQMYTSTSNPLSPAGFNGSCQFPQITGQGLLDSRQHGKDLFDVYHGLLGFLPSTYDPSTIHYRVTNNPIPSQVMGQVIQGQYPGLTNKPVTVYVQPRSIDSLEPSYHCPSADKLRKSYAVGGSAPNWTLHLDQAAPLFDRLDAISGINATSHPDWHSWFDHYYDNLSARLCHQKPLPCSTSPEDKTDQKQCTTQTDADTVFRLGQYEYSFLYRDAPQSLAASTSAFGIWLAELASNLRAAINAGTASTCPGPGTAAAAAPGVIYRHNVAHDGSMSRLLSVLQVDTMVWPGMGAEVVFELYRRRHRQRKLQQGPHGCWYLRVLWGGQVLVSSNPSLGRMDLIPVESLLAYIDGLVGVGAQKVPELCREG